MINMNLLKSDEVPQNKLQSNIKNIKDNGDESSFLKMLMLKDKNVNSTSNETIKLNTNILFDSKLQNKTIMDDGNNLNVSNVLNENSSSENDNEKTNLSSLINIIFNSNLPVIQTFESAINNLTKDVTVKQVMEDSQISNLVVANSENSNKKIDVSMINLLPKSSNRNNIENIKNINFYDDEHNKKTTDSSLNILQNNINDLVLNVKNSDLNNIKKDEIIKSYGDIDIQNEKFTEISSSQNLVMQNIDTTKSNALHNRYIISDYDSTLNTLLNNATVKQKSQLKEENSFANENLLTKISKSAVDDNITTKVISFPLKENMSQNTKENSLTNEFNEAFAKSKNIKNEADIYINHEDINNIDLQSFDKIIKISDESSKINTEVLTQLKDKISMMYDEKTSQVTMQLFPKNLGKVDIKMTFDNYGLKVDITSFNDETNKIIKSNVNELISALKNSSDKPVEIIVKNDMNQNEKNHYYNDQSNNNNDQNDKQRKNKYYYINNFENDEEKNGVFEKMINEFN